MRVKVLLSKALPILLPILMGISLFYLSYRSQVLSLNESNIIRADGIGYYSYLPAIFIYNDLSFEFLDDKNLIGGDGYCRIKTKENRVHNKYTVGMSVLQLPFFGAACLYAKIMHLPINGFGKTFHLFFLVGFFFYVTLGLIFLIKYLYLIKIPTYYIAVIVLIYTLGSFVFHYLNYDVFLSHGITLSLLFALSYFIVKFNIASNIYYSIMIGLIFTLIISLRPFNMVMILFLPLYFRSFKETLFFLKRLLSKSIWVLFPFAIIFIVQSIIWKIQTGHWVVYSYGSEKFIWGTHDLLYALFSYKRGFLVYSPIFLFIFIASLAALIHKKKWLNLTYYLGLFALLFVVLSSWSSKDYGQCLGYRPMVDFSFLLLFPLLIFPLKFFKYLSVKIIALILVLISILYSITLSVQYQQNIIPWHGPTKSQFWEVFGKTDARYNYHFSFPQHIDSTQFQKYYLQANAQQIATDKGQAFIVPTFLKSKIYGMGVYGKIKLEQIERQTLVIDCFEGKETIAWQHKLIAKDVKHNNSFQSFYNEIVTNEKNMDSLNVKLINIKEFPYEIKDIEVVLFYKNE